MDNNLKTFAKRLMQARLKAKLSMEKLSEKMNGIVTKQAISKYEKAKMMPNSTILIAMAEALNVDLDYFFRPFTFDLDQFKVSFRISPTQLLAIKRRSRFKSKTKLSVISKLKKS